MKKFLLLILICSAQNIFSQARNSKTKKIEVVKSDPVDRPRIIDTTISEEDKVHNTSAVEVMPQFPGGINEFYKFIAQNYIIPKEKPTVATGKIYASFVIEKNGLINDVKILKDLGYGTGNELIRVLKLSPKWEPGKVRDKEVRVQYTIPITI
ncbi:energy transducer TonB [Flavobacterium artemisiae]